MDGRPVSAAWWTGIPPAEVTIDCRGERHRLTWQDGVLTFPDHRGAGRRPPVRRGDPPRRTEAAGEAEIGEGCDAAARAWRALRADRRPLVLGRRHPGESLESAGTGGDAAAWLLALVGPALERRLQAEAASNLGEAAAADDAHAIAVVEAATVGRVQPVLDRWLGPGHGATVSLGLRSEVVAGRRPAVILTPGWLGEVWGRYLSIVDGFFVLDVLRVVDDRAEVVGVSRPGGEEALLTLTGPAPWRARSREPR